MTTIYIDKVNNETDITVTSSFKLRLRHFAANLLNLEKLPTVRELSKLYNLKLVKPRGIGADLITYSLNWMKLYATLEDAAYNNANKMILIDTITDISEKEEDHYQFAFRSTKEIKALSDKYQVVVCDHNQVIPTYSIKIMKKDVKGFNRVIGSIHGDWMTKQYSVSVTGWSKGVSKLVTSPSQAINIMLTYFQKEC
jgi:hypothetical protein